MMKTVTKTPMVQLTAVMNLSLMKILTKKLIRKAAESWAVFSAEKMIHLMMTAVFPTRPRKVKEVGLWYLT